MRAPGAARFCLLLSWVLGGCAGQNHSIDYKLYPGPVRDDSELATIRAGNGVHDVLVDGLMFSTADYRAVKVSPGEHVIEWVGDFLASGTGRPNDRYRKSIRITVDLGGGFTYYLQADHYDSPELRHMFWIRIEETGDILNFGDG